MAAHLASRSTSARWPVAHRRRRRRRQRCSTRSTHRDDVTLVPYVTSFRGPAAPTACAACRCPAALAHRLWSRVDRPRVDRWLRGVRRVHGTNYVVPPSRCRGSCRCTTAGSCAIPTRRTADVRARRRGAAPRACAHGAVVHAVVARHRRRVARAAAAGRRVARCTWPRSRCRRPRRPCAHRRARRRATSSLAIGTLERRKNLPRLVEAFGLLAAEHRRAAAGARRRRRRRPRAPSTRAIDRARRRRPPRGSC